jgi:hypothetical protein
LTEVSIPAFALVTQKDDSGSKTADRYDWQAAMAVVDAMALAVKLWDPEEKQLSSALSIICEYHEDYMVIWDNRVEIVSVKHRDRGQPAWTIVSFLEAGGLAHLFLSWIYLQQECTTLLVTTNPAQAGEAAAFFALVERLNIDSPELDEPESIVFKSFASSLHGRLPQEAFQTDWSLVDGNGPSAAFLALVLDFLKSLTIDCGRSDRDELRFAAVARYVEPFLSHLGVPKSLGPEVWRQCTAMVAERMRDKGLGSLGGLQDVVDRFLPGGAAAAIRRLTARTFTGEELLAIVEVCAALGLESVQAVDRMPATILAAKLVNGGCSPTTVRAAERQAELWREFEVRLATDDSPGASSDLVNIRDWALLKASHAHEAAQSAEVPGRAMWQSLAGFVADPIPVTNVALTSDLLVGAVCALASECKVWFSDEFDMNAALAALPNRLPLEKVIA